MLWSARTARMELLPHQLEPALAIVSGLGTRVLLADEVGLGKTVQAGLVVAELQARGALTRVLVLTPAGLCAQWAAELGNRFQLCPAVLGMQEVKKRRARLPAGVNPWS
ncbi:MAG: helicase, partial [Acidobacteria bacterium]